MTSGNHSSPNKNPKDPFEILGIQPGASFDLIKKARDKRLAEVGDNPQERSKIESSYDALLMNSLKERQSGKISNAAASASQKENGKVELGSAKNISGSILTRLKSIKSDNSSRSGNTLIPEISFPQGQELTIKIAFFILSVVLLFVSPESSIELILALSTIGLFISQIKRGRKPIPSLGWSVVLLSIGLICGGLLINETSSQGTFMSTITPEQLEALPAVILIWTGAILLD